LPITISTSAGSSWDLGQISLENAEGGGATVSALGINGAKLTQTQKWRKAWLDDLKASQANVVILAYGTNEAFNDDLDIAETEQYWTSVIRQIKKTLPKAKIVVLGAPESLKSTAGSCGTRPVMLDAVQQMQQRIAKAEKTLFWSWEKAMGGRCTMKSWIAQGLAARDGVHFSATGYKTVARQFANDILKLVR
jgi:lysophospholipase L1-like esterase